MAETTPVEEITKIVRDAFYVTVGFGLLAFQKAQVQRNEIRKQIDSQLGEAKDQFHGLGKTVEERVKLVEERLEGIEGRVDAALDQFEERLPVQAKELVKTARGAAKDAQGQLRTLVGRSTNGSAA